MRIGKRELSTSGLEIWNMRRSQKGSSRPRWLQAGRALGAGLAVVLATGFSAGCSDNVTTDVPTTGTLLITVTTTGDDQDGNYTVWVDDALSYPIASGAEVLLDDVPIGSYVLELRDVAPNCTVTTENPKTTSVIRSFEIAVSFGVTCEDAGSTRPDPNEPIE